MYNPMKKGVLVATLLGATALTMNAQTLKVLGTDVTETTAAITTETEGCTIEGTVSYDADSKTLTLDNAVLTSHKPNTAYKDQTTVNVIESDIDGLTIKVLGESKLRSSMKNYCLKLAASTTITGEGSHLLTITDARLEDEGLSTSSLAPRAIQLTNNDATVTLKDCNILCHLGFSGVGYDRNGWNGIGNLVIDHTNFDIPYESNESTFSNIAYFNSLTLIGCEYVDPTPSTLQLPYDYEGWSGVITRYLLSADGESTYQGEIHIATNDEPVMEGNLTVCGTPITGNVDYLDTETEGCTITGVVSYDVASKTLTLDNAVLTSHKPNTAYKDQTTVNVIESDVDGLVIKVIGESKLRSSMKNYCLKLAANTTITGDEGHQLIITDARLEDEEMSANSLSPRAIQLTNNDATVTLKDANILCRMGFSGVGYDRNGWNGIGNLVIDHTNFDIPYESNESTFSNIAYFNSLTLIDCEYVDPTPSTLQLPYDYDGWSGVVTRYLLSADGESTYLGEIHIATEGSVQPEKPYLKVAGIEVFDGDVTSEEENTITGTVTFDAESKTLTLDNAVITSATNGIECDNELTIILKGDNKIVFDDDAFGMVFGDWDVTLTSEDGTGKLTISNASMDADGTNAWFQALKMNGNATLTIDNCSVVSYEGMVPDLTRSSFSAEYAHGFLVVKNADVEFLTNLDDDYPVLGFFANITLEDSKFETPSDGQYDQETGFIMSDQSEYDGYWYNDVKIVRDVETPLPAYLKVMGQEVSNGVVETVDAFNQIMGDVTFDAETKTLTLDNAIIDTNNNAIETENDLTIRLVGDNRIVVDSEQDIFALVLKAKNVTITSDDGEGTLTIMGSAMAFADDYDADLAGFQTMQLGENTTLTIDNAQFITYEGVNPANHKFEVPNNVGYLVLNKANFVTMIDCDENERNTKYWPTFGFFAGLTMTDCEMVMPEDGVYNPETGFVDSEEWGYEGYYYGVVRISRDGKEPKPEPTEYVAVAGLYLTETTDEVVPTTEGSAITTGKVSFDAETKTLTLDNATITCHIEDGYADDNIEDGIENTIDGLTIRLIGDNQISYGWGKGLVAWKSLTLISDDGTGTLTVGPADSNNLTLPDALIVDEEATLTLKNATLTINTPVNMLGDDEEGMGGTLAIDNATMEIVKGYGFGYLENVTALELTGTTVYDANDEELTFDADKHMVVNAAGNRYKGAITIKPTIEIPVPPTGISTMEQDADQQTMFNLSGQQLKGGNVQTSRLPKGVYVSKGRKVVVK